MITHAAITIRCDGRDSDQGDQCKRSLVLSLPLGDFSQFPRNPTPAEQSVFIISRVPGWGVVIDGKVVCPDCLSKASH